MDGRWLGGCLAEVAGSWAAGLDRGEAVPGFGGSPGGKSKTIPKRIWNLTDAGILSGLTISTPLKARNMDLFLTLKSWFN